MTIILLGYQKVKMDSTCNGERIFLSRVCKIFISTIKLELTAQYVHSSKSRRHASALVSRATSLPSDHETVRPLRSTGSDSALTPFGGPTRSGELPRRSAGDLHCRPPLRRASPLEDSPLVTRNPFGSLISLLDEVDAPFPDKK